MAFIIHGIDDSVHTCDCCGRSNLKNTVIVEDEAGEKFNYGSVCATRHTKYTTKEIKEKLHAAECARQAAYEARWLVAQAKYNVTPEAVRLNQVMNEAYARNLIGVVFRDYTAVAREQAQAVRKEIEAQFEVQFIG